MTTRFVRRAFLATAIAVALALGTVAPATARSADPIGDLYGGTNLGIIHLYNDASNGTRLGLQATNEVYYTSNETRYVAVGNLDIDHQKWYLIKLPNGYYKFINVATGMALQKTNESRPAGLWTTEVITSPAWWNNDYQQWEIVPRYGVTGNTVYIYNRVLTANGQYNDMLKATQISYRGYADFYQIETSASGAGGWNLGTWTIPEVTFSD